MSSFKVRGRLLVNLIKRIFAFLKKLLGFIGKERERDNENTLRG